MEISLTFLLCYVHIMQVATLRYVPDSPPSLQIHDDKFHPDGILRVTAQMYDQDCTSRYSVVINGSIPGPELRFKEGDKVWIRVYNDMQHENVTVHWHGLTQRMSPFSDGTPAASQWPISPLHFFDYEFQLQKGDAGTYYYHSHVGFQLVTAFGALIVEESHESKPPFYYDDERTIVISDIFHSNDSYILQGLMMAPFRWSGETNNLALNGKSRQPNVTLKHATTSCQHAVIKLDPGKVYRLRFIGATALSLVYIALEKHSEMMLIEVDSRYISPVSIDHLEIHSGQRYSVLLQGKSVSQLKIEESRGRRQFWIQMETRSRSLITTAYAVLTYSVYSDYYTDTFNLPVTKPLLMSNETFTEGWLEDVLQPFQEQSGNPFPRLDEVTRRITVDIQQVYTNGTFGFITWVATGSSWFENTPQEPYLVSLYKNETKFFPSYKRALLNKGFDPVTKTFPAKIGEVLEIIWQNLGNTFTGIVETHPLHAHGEHFYDIGSGTGKYHPEENEARLRARAYRIVTRDTTNLYRTPPPQKLKPGDVYSWRAWRIRVQSPGVWMVHCHIMPHMAMGMQTVWVFGEAKDMKPLNKAQASGYLNFGGTALGNSTFSPAVVHYWHD